MTANTAPLSDVAIIGGGPVGMTLALALAANGLEVTLIDRLAAGIRSAPDVDGRA